MYKIHVHIDKNPAYVNNIYTTCIIQKLSDGEEFCKKHLYFQSDTSGQVMVTDNLLLTISLQIRIWFKLAVLLCAFCHSQIVVNPKNSETEQETRNIKHQTKWIQ